MPKQEMPAEGPNSEQVRHEIINQDNHEKHELELRSKSYELKKNEISKHTSKLLKKLQDKNLTETEFVDTHEHLYKLSKFERWHNTEKIKEIIGNNPKTGEGSMNFGLDEIGAVGISYIEYKSLKDDTEYAYCSVGEPCDPKWFFATEQDGDENKLYAIERYKENFIVKVKLFDPKSKQQLIKSADKGMEGFGIYKKTGKKTCRKTNIAS